MTDATARMDAAMDEVTAGDPPPGKVLTVGWYDRTTGDRVDLTGLTVKEVANLVTRVVRRHRVTCAACGQTDTVDLTGTMFLRQPDHDGLRRHLTFHCPRPGEG